MTTDVVKIIIIISIFRCIFREMFFPEMGTGFMGSNANQARIGNIFILIISQAGGRFSR